jgi:magnesium-protoporphyrin O-methyltransferase
MSTLVGDAVELAGRLPRADVVTLDRVLCCYPNMPALVAVSAARAESAWGVVFPREQWIVRLGVAAINLFQRLRGKEFRVYLHGEERIAAEALRHGLEPGQADRTFLWQVRVFRRKEPPGEDR